MLKCLAEQPFREQGMVLRVAATRSCKCVLQHPHHLPAEAMHGEGATAASDVIAKDETCVP
eukprot:13888-Heterococcus_DN1.PRE.4